MVHRFMKVEIRTKENYVTAKLPFPILLLILLVSPIRAQQAGAVVGATPGSAIRNFPKAVPARLTNPGVHGPDIWQGWRQSQQK